MGLFSRAEKIRRAATNPTIKTVRSQSSLGTMTWCAQLVAVDGEILVETRQYPSPEKALQVLKSLRGNKKL